MATHLLPAPPVTLKTKSPSSSARTALSTSLLSPPLFGRDFSGHRIQNPSLNKRGGGVVRVVPSRTGRKGPPPDLSSHLLAERIVFLGLGLAPMIGELIILQLLHLNQVDEKTPIKLYINCTGTEKYGRKIGRETDVFALYDMMQQVSAPVHTLCIGNAWGEAALLLAAGANGHRNALPSANIVLKEPWDRFQGQASDVFIHGDFVKMLKNDMVRILAKHIGKSPEVIEADMRYPKYFGASQAMEYGIIDKVLYNERVTEDVGVVADLKKANIV